MTTLRVFVASPSDLDEERKLLEAVIQELNLIWPQQWGISFELIKWETHVFPGAGTDPQDVINHQLTTDYDILLAMFWSRIGTPTPRSESGTIEEFDIAYTKWKRDPQSIRLMVYFKLTPISPDDIDTEQLKLVKEFRSSLKEKGILYSKFTGREEFSQLMRLHLNKQAYDFFKVNEVVNKPNNAPITSTIPPISHIEKQIELLENEGFLDLIKIAETGFQKAAEVMKHIVGALEKLTSGTQQSKLDLKSVAGDDQAKIAAYETIVNRQADKMADFVTYMRPKTPILDDSLSKALDAYGRMIHLLPNFDSNVDNFLQLKNALSNAATLRTAMLVAKESTERFRSSTAVLPELNSQFNHSKIDLVNLLDSFLNIYNRGINLLGEIDITGNSILNS